MTSPTQQLRPATCCKGVGRPPRRAHPSGSSAKSVNASSDVGLPVPAPIDSFRLTLSLCARVIDRLQFRLAGLHHPDARRPLLRAPDAPAPPPPRAARPISSHAWLRRTNNQQGQCKCKQTRSKASKMPKKSDVWKHFTRLTLDHGNLLHQARCNSCPDGKVLETKDGTTNMWRHFNKFHNQEVAAAGAARTPQPQLPAPPCAPSRHAGSPGRKPVLGDEHASADLARMIALRGYDASFVEDSYFRSFVQSLDPEFEVPSRVAIEEMCDDIFDDARRELKSKLRRAPGRVSLALGKAKTIEAGEVMYIACHLIDDQWNLHKFVLDAFLVQGAKRDYTVGPVLGVHVFDDDHPFDDIFHVIYELDDRLSMVAYDITDRDFPPGLKNYIDEDINSDANKLSCTTTTYVDTVLHSIARCLLPDVSEFTVDMFTEMTKLTRQERLQLLSKLDLDLELAFDKSWCATYSSLQVLRKRGSTDQLVGAELCEKPLCKVWEQVYSSIQTISASTFPTSNLCLAELFKLREILHSELPQFSGDDADVQDRNDYYYFDKEVNALRETSGTLDKAIQDSYLIWSVPLALDPRYKLGYIELSFERAFGSEATKYITEVNNKINKLYADYIKEYGTITDADHSDGANATVATTSVHPLEQAWKERRRSQEVMAAQVNPETQTELSRYLQDPFAPEDFHVLNWWKENRGRYPMVARMARDALAMPTCSKLSSDQLAQVRSILRGYSKKLYRHMTFSSSSPSEGGDMIQ
ncbi:hypothetical protein PVAP13_6KG175140 [Panicum virgatum]|uniref:BED-type domain-containing protein n=1 Tax=Panicum virgatum TaxID=38727 RepID=A0A8T0R8P7_PANVG|nr:hypothetical protein PVAP13_6KG175140 [Panicum virgatum]